MIWNDEKLQFGCFRSALVSPLGDGCINPASIDLRIDGHFIDLHTGEPFQDDCIAIQPGDAILATTIEIVRIPVDAAASIYLKSSMARKGLDHALAGWIDPGFQGQITLELHAHRPLTLTRGQRVIQMVVWSLNAPSAKPYQGRYQFQRGPTPARTEANK